MTPEAPANGLERKLGLFPLTNIVIANMIGAGIFTTSGLLMKDLHHPVVMLGLWLPRRPGAALRAPARGGGHEEPLPHPDHRPLPLPPHPRARGRGPGPERADRAEDPARRRPRRRRIRRRQGELLPSRPRR